MVSVSFFLRASQKGLSAADRGRLPCSMLQRERASRQRSRVPRAMLPAAGGARGGCPGARELPGSAEQEAQSPRPRAPRLFIPAAPALVFTFSPRARAQRAEGRAPSQAWEFSPGTSCAARGAQAAEGRARWEPRLWGGGHLASKGGPAAFPQSGLGAAAGRGPAGLCCWAASGLRPPLGAQETGAVPAPSAPLQRRCPELAALGEAGSATPGAGMGARSRARPSSGLESRRAQPARSVPWGGGRQSDVLLGWAGGGSLRGAPASLPWRSPQGRRTWVIPTPGPWRLHRHAPGLSLSVGDAQHAAHPCAAALLRARAQEGAWRPPPQSGFGPHTRACS